MAAGFPAKQDGSNQIKAEFSGQERLVTISCFVAVSLGEGVKSALDFTSGEDESLGIISQALPNLQHIGGVRHALRAGIRQRVRDRWNRAVGAAGTIAILSAVVVAGGGQLGSEVLSVWKKPGNAEQALASSSHFAGLLNFEAPAMTAERFKTETEEFENSMRSTSNALLLAKSWKYGVPHEK